ncbi:MAG: M15 family metallopeptidase, partial [Oscillospiraceae bacterium]|nr:M15 family metallopeptidase [Oscillospiraceae bacterium]
SSYRPREKQEELFRNKKERLLAQGYSEKDAETEAGKEVAVPGTSEHQLGLALDIVDVNHQLLDSSQENTAVQKWLMDHSWEYGFILRYPSGKSDITGIIYEPWHYRYVGKDAAKEIYEQGICLEEYLENPQ